MRLLKIGLLVFVPVAVIADLIGGSPILVFFAAALALVPLAGWMGTATEHLAVHTGPRMGGLLNATLGNAAELIITVVALRAGALNPHLREGMNELVKASITGSILGNLLLVLGFSILCGGLKHGTQTFDRQHAGVNSTMLILAVIALGVPSLFGYAMEPDSHAAVEYLSVGVAVVMIFVYILSLVFSFRAGPLREMGHTDPSEGPAHGEGSWSVALSVGVLILATVFTAWLSEVLIGAVEPVVERLGMTEFFLGVVLVPLVGNVAEHFVAVQVALKNRMELSLAIALGSSLQIALFVAPLLVFIALLLGSELTLVFNRFELVALLGAVWIASHIASDGESNWLEGAQLLVVYVIIGMAFFFLPTG